MAPKLLLFKRAKSKGYFTWIIYNLIFMLWSDLTTEKTFDYLRLLPITNRLASGHGDMGTRLHQVLAATLTLSQPGAADYTHAIMMSPPSFESHRRAWPILLKVLFTSVCRDQKIIFTSENLVPQKQTIRCTRPTLISVMGRSLSF